MNIFEFNDCDDEINNKLEIKENEQGYDIFISNSKEEKLLLSSYRDQWGVFYNFHLDELNIAQEDYRLSFLDALIQSLIEFRKLNETTLDCLKKEVK